MSCLLMVLLPHTGIVCNFLHTLHMSLHQWHSSPLWQNARCMHGVLHAFRNEMVGPETDCYLRNGGVRACTLQTWKWKRTNSCFPACMKQTQPACAVAALSVHTRLQTLINFPDWAEPLLMKRLILRAGGIFHHLMCLCDSSIPSCLVFLIS